ncbi:MAG: VapB-type antitoxin [Nitrososphaeria archaeon]
MPLRLCPPPLPLYVKNYARVNFLFFHLVIFSGEKLNKTVTVSTKIPTELKEKMKQLKIKPSKLLRKAIEDEIRKREAQKLKEDIEKLKPTLDKVDVDKIVESIREDRTRR